MGVHSQDERSPEPQKSPKTVFDYQDIGKTEHARQADTMGAGPSRNHAHAHANARTNRAECTIQTCAAHGNRKLQRVSNTQYF